MYSDSHCHLDSYPEEELNLVLEQMKVKNISLVLNVAINLETSEESLRIAGANENIYTAVGIHPGEAVPLTPDVKKQLEELSLRKGVSALGEIGLDYGHPSSNRDMQKELFSYQLSLAKNAGLPVDIHYSNNAHQDIMKILHGENGSITGIVHGFLGGMQELKDWLDLGFYISLGQLSVGIDAGLPQMMPPLTEEVIRTIPAEKLISETDAMARMSVSRWKIAGPPPMPEGAAPIKEEFRQPADVIGVVKKIASVLEESVSKISEITTANLKQVLKIG